MGVFVVTWDGPERGQRAQASWNSLENAQSHYDRKARAGLNPELGHTDDIEDALAARTLEDQP